MDIIILSYTSNGSPTCLHYVYYTLSCECIQLIFDQLVLTVCHVNDS